MKRYLILEVDDPTEDEMYTIGILNYLNRVADGKTKCQRLSPSGHAALIQAAEAFLRQMQWAADVAAHSASAEVRQASIGYGNFADALAEACRILGDPFTSTIPDTIAGINHS